MRRTNQAKVPPMRSRSGSLGWLALAVLLLCGCRAARPAPGPGDLVLRARTGDGWELAIAHYPGTAPVRGRPVLLCPGLSSNDRSLDLDPEHSLARWLARQGRDVWLLSVRGVGWSRPVEGLKRGAAAGADLTLDALWREDLATALRLVRRESNAAAVDVIGYSLGGMLLYAYLAEGGEGVGAAVTMAAPTRLDGSGFWIQASTTFARWFAMADRPLPFRFLVQAATQVHPAVPGDPLETLLYNPGNVRASEWSRFSAEGFDDLPGGLALQLARMVETGRFESADGRIDYRRDMGRIKIPILVVAGKLDRLATTPAVRDGFVALGGPKEWLVLGEENGLRSDYGHLDPIVGERASIEVWPRLLEFLDRHAG